MRSLFKEQSGSEAGGRSLLRQAGRLSVHLQKAHGPQRVGDPHPQAAASGRMSSRPDPRGLGRFPLWRGPGETAALLS